MLEGVNLYRHDLKMKRRERGFHMIKKTIACFASAAILLASFPVTAAYAEGPTVNAWVSQVNSTNTGMAKGLEEQAPLHFSDDNGARISNLIVVDENNTYQTMDGFGASITEASAHLYQTSLSEGDKTSLMNALFDKETGIGLSMLRQPIGATDHSVAP